MNRSVSVKCENRSQYCYMVAWCEDHGFGTPKKPVPMGCYPIILYINRDYSTATWTNVPAENGNYVTFEEFTDCGASTDAVQSVESDTWTKLKWWQQIKRGDKFLDLPTDKWVACVNLVGLLAWDLIVIRPSKPHYLKYKSYN